MKRIIRAADVPVNLNTLLSLIQFGKDDEPSLATDVVRYKGEPILGIVATSERAARQALALVRVSYDPLPAVFDVEEALKPGAPSVNPTYPRNTFEYHGKYDHQKLRFGDVEAGFAQADVVVEDRYQMSPIEHAPIETNGSIAVPDTNGRFIVYTSTQALFFSLDTAAKINAMPSNQLHFIGGTVGGGFGGKVDTLTEPLVILAARLTGAPVRYRLSRHEEMQFGSPRGAERIYVKDGVMKDGRIIARQVRAYFDSGAYTRLSSYAVVKCVAHIPGPYTIPNVHADVFCVYTNRTPATAMRGFGVTALDFALECQMDKLAVAIGMDPLEFRMLNVYRDGDMKAHRREAKNCALIECAQVAAGKANWPLRDEFRRMSSRTGGGAGHAGAARTVAPARLPRRRGRRLRNACPTIAACHRAGTDPAAGTSAKRAATSCTGGCRIDARRSALFFSLRYQEALIMAKHRGRGVATINYPIGMNLGGDPSQALVHSNPSGKFTVALSSIDLGQGMKSVTRQICAETLGVPVEDVYVDTAELGYRPALHGLVCLARNAPRRQRSDGGGARGTRSHDGGGGRRA